MLVLFCVGQQLSFRVEFDLLFAARKIDNYRLNIDCSVVHFCSTEQQKNLGLSLFPEELFRYFGLLFTDENGHWAA